MPGQGWKGRDNQYEVWANSKLFQQNRIELLTSYGDDRFRLHCVSSLVDEDVREVILRQIRWSHPSSSHEGNHKNPNVKNIQDESLDWYYDYMSINIFL